MPGALPPLRVLVMSPKLVAEASDTPGFAQFARLKRLKTSNRNWMDACSRSAVVRTENYILAMKSPFSDDAVPISSSN
jgi:hypothetical protein